MITRDDVQGALSKPPASNGHSRPMAAPAVRKLARDHGFDLAAIRGTGKDGRVTRADVENILALPKTAAAEPIHVPAKADVAPVPMVDGERREIPMSRIRQVIASRLAQSAQEAPHFYVTAELDLTSALEKLPQEIGVNNLLLFLTVQTLKDVPDLNATYEEGHLYQYVPINLAIAVALPTGLITPVLHHADDFSLKGLAARAKDLIARTRENRLRSEELGGGTFTVSNLGMIQQIERFTAIINPPQVAILAVGAAKPRPVVIDGGLHIRTTVHLTVSADHRIIDGLIVARFLEAFDKRLQAFSS
jgi:pyruvate dehydrogenase E2 component (dihydrolipoamide acetyltransferase)